MEIPEAPRTRVFTDHRILRRELTVSAGTCVPPRIPDKDRFELETIATDLMSHYTLARRQIAPSYRPKQEDRAKWQSVAVRVRAESIKPEGLIKYGFRANYPYPKVDAFFSGSLVDLYVATVGRCSYEKEARDDVRYIMDVVSLHMKAGRCMYDILHDSMIRMNAAVKYVLAREYDLPEVASLLAPEAMSFFRSRPAYTDVLRPYLTEEDIKCLQ